MCVRVSVSPHPLLNWPISVKPDLAVKDSKLLRFSGNNIQEDGLIYAVVEEKISLTHLLIDTKESTQEPALKTRLYSALLGTTCFLIRSKTQFQI